MSINKQSNLCCVSDLALTAILSMKHSIIEINKETPRKAVFIFKQTPDLKELADQYWRRELSVEPQEFFAALKSVKARLYNE